MEITKRKTHTRVCESTCARGGSGVVYSSVFRGRARGPLKKVFADDTTKIALPTAAGGRSSSPCADYIIVNPPFLHLIPLGHPRDRCLRKTIYSPARSLRAPRDKGCFAEGCPRGRRARAKSAKDVCLARAAVIINIVYIRFGAAAWCVCCFGVFKLLGF